MSDFDIVLRGRVVLPTKGALMPGRDADIVVLTPEPRRYDAAASGHNVVGWSPYNGIELPWRVSATYRRGELVFDGSAVLAPPGSGRFVRPPSTRPIASAIGGHQGRQQ